MYFSICIITIIPKMLIIFEFLEYKFIFDISTFFRNSFVTSQFPEAGSIKTFPISNIKYLIIFSPFNIYGSVKTL